MQFAGGKGRVRNAIVEPLDCLVFIGGGAPSDAGHVLQGLQAIFSDCQSERCLFR
jgi:hypothetical protein